MAYKYSHTKWSKHKLMWKSKTLRRSLPTTRPLSYNNLFVLLRRYGKVIVKPSGSFGGFGVIQVTRVGSNKFKVHKGRAKKTLKGRKAAYRYVSRGTGKASNIVQKRIPLARVHGRPFDIRVMVQQTRKAGWRVTGKLVKVAGGGYIITNMARSGGHVTTLSNAIHRSNIPSRLRRRIHARVDGLALQAVRQLHPYYRPIHSVGLDVGLDGHGKPWIIEANFKPDFGLFAHLRDKSMFKRIRAIRSQWK